MSPSNMSKVPQDRRHYSTIGMGEYFVQPPPRHTLPAAYLAEQSRHCKSPDWFLTWEISGTIKASPQDFIVREIASLSRTPEFPSSKVDVIAADDVLVKDTSTIIDRESGSGAPSGRKDKNSEDIAPGMAGDSKPAPDSESALGTPVLPVLDPLQVVKTVLESLEQNGQLESAEDTFAELQLLHDRAVNKLGQIAHNHLAESPNLDDEIWIPTLSTECAFAPGADEATGGDRGAFRRALRSLFPLLNNCRTVQEHEKKRSDRASDRLSVDDTFFALASSLFRPCEDLVKLYRFWNRGCVALDQARPRSSKQKRRGTKRGRGDETHSIDSLDSQVHVALRLRPDLPRAERGPLHHLISSKCKQFVTTTVNLNSRTESGDSGDCSASPLPSAAIVVQWSPHACSRAASQKEAGVQPDRRETQNSSALCVLKKTQMEHLTAMQQISAALKCRQADIGIGGIKDMQAVTYQFCTIRHMTSKQVSSEACIRLKKHGLELSPICNVNFHLNNGDLAGNRFEIWVRDLRRIRVDIKDGIAVESYVACDPEHVMQMAERVKMHGFINYFGEQRVGRPGNMVEVGTRAFDVGRAMLRRNFSEAIDLLMRGRRDVEGPEICRARQVWLDTGGDAAQTLNALPKGNAMARERIILQGLKRHGTSNALAALRCLPFSIRMYWINAYQSLVWNLMASERFERLGMDVVEGDLYEVKNKEGLIEVVDSVSKNLVDISQIVLPLPGYNTQYPENQIGVLYREYLNKDGISFCRDAPPEATAKGGYRKLVGFANDLEVSIQSSTPESADSMKLKFDLSSGCYATVLLRELMVTTVARHDRKPSSNT